MKLIFVTNRYPFSHGETFLETERKYTPKLDDVIFLPWETTDYAETRKGEKYEKVFKDNCVISENYFIKFLKSLKDIFSLAFITEIKYLLLDKKFTVHRVRQILFFLRDKKKRICKMDNFLKQQGIKGDDEIIFYSYWLNHTAFIACELSKKYKNAKVISRAHRYDLYQEENDGYIPFQRSILNNLDEIYCIAEDGKKYLVSKYPEVKEKIKISRLGTDDHGIQQYRNRDVLKIVSCSYVVPVKRVYLIVEILSKIKDIQVEWTHIGDGNDLEKIKEMCAKKLSGNVNTNFVGGMSNSNVIETYKNNEYHLFINVSESEGIPVSIMEAISFGIPVMATDVGGTREIVNDISGKLLEKSFDIQVAVEYVKKIAFMEDREYKTLRKSVRAFWENNYLAEDNYKMFYNELIRLE